MNLKHYGALITVLGGITKIHTHRVTESCEFHDFIDSDGGIHFQVMAMLDKDADSVAVVVTSRHDAVPVVKERPEPSVKAKKITKREMLGHKFIMIEPRTEIKIVDPEILALEASLTETTNPRERLGIENKIKLLKLKV